MLPAVTQSRLFNDISGQDASAVWWVDGERTPKNDSVCPGKRYQRANAVNYQIADKNVFMAGRMRSTDDSGS